MQHLKNKILKVYAGLPRYTYLEPQFVLWLLLLLLLLLFFLMLKGVGGFFP